MKYILGISCFYHDSAASIIKNGEIIACAQEERFSRIKHDSNFPEKSIKYCLNACNIKISDLEAVVFYEKPLIKFERLLETYISFFPWGLKSFIASFPLWIKHKLFQKNLIIKKIKEIDSNFDKRKIKFSEHHLSHAASAFFPSPFQKSVILTIDGVGEWTTCSVSLGNENKIKIEKEIQFPHSIGLIYSAFTYFLGFKVNSGEYKVMGLAPYGEAKYLKLIKDELIDIKDDGSFLINQKYFDYSTGLKMTSKKFEDLFNIKRKNPEDKIEQIHMDIAASIQKIIEDIIITMCNDLHAKYKIDNICLAGGVALNCVANGKLINKTPFKKIWIQPASSDSGGSLGGALSYWYMGLKNKRNIYPEDAMKGSYLGPEYSNEQIENELKEIGAIYETLDTKEIIKLASLDLSKGKCLGWFQDRMEFGPRALGNRSILADPRNLQMQETLNLKIKFRESFRPFAPAILEEFLDEYYENKIISPYMLLVDYVNQNKRKKFNINEFEKKFGIEKLKFERSIIPAVTHLDYSSRIQTVNGKFNKKFYDLITSFYNLTNCPILINTSFNIRGEPIVQSIKDAYNCFMGTNLDVLICGDFYLDKKKQKTIKNNNYKEKFKLD